MPPDDPIEHASGGPSDGPFSLPQSSLVRYGDIDAEHQDLVDILNETLENFDSDGRVPSVPFLPYAARLQDHLRTHFANEEIAMAAVRYPDLAAHRAHHAGLIAKVSALRDEARHSTQIGKEAVFKLFDNVFDDLLRADLPFKSYLDANGLTDEE